MGILFMISAGMSDRIFDQSFTPFGDFLFLFLCMDNYSGITYGNRTAKMVCLFYFVKLPFYRLAEFHIVDVTQNIDLITLPNAFSAL